MSVQSNTYVIFGVMFAPDIFSEEALEALEPHMDSAFKPAHPFSDLTVVYDGMSGEYLVIGFVLARSNDQQGEGLPFTKIPVLTDEQEAQMLEKIWAIAPIPEQQPAAAWYALTHYR